MEINVASSSLSFGGGGGGGVALDWFGNCVSKERKRKKGGVHGVGYDAGSGCRVSNLGRQGWRLEAGRWMAVAVFCR